MAYGTHWRCIAEGSIDTFVASSLGERQQRVGCHSMIITACTCRENMHSRTYVPPCS